MNDISEKMVKLLLVEDNPGDVELTLMAFEESGLSAEIEVVTDGEEAIDFIYKKNQFENAFTPDLILLDINLPKINGLEILDKIKSDENYRMIPVIILTTSSTDKDILKAYSKHVNAYLNKPVDFMSFIDVVKSINQFWFMLAKIPS